MIKKLWMPVILIIYLTFGKCETTIGQCGGAINIYQKLEKLSHETLSSNDKLSRLELLKSEFIKCKYSQDSIYAKILHLMASPLKANGDIYQSISVLEEAVRINSQTGTSFNRSQCANSYFNLLIRYIELNLEDKAKFALSNIISLAKQYPSKILEEASAYNNVSYYYGEKGDYELAVEYARLGGKIAQKAKNNDYESESLVMEGQSLRALNKLDQARTAFDKAEIVLGKNKDKETLSLIYQNIALLEKKRRNFGEAIRYYLRASQLLLPLLGSNPSVGRNYAAILNNVGDIYREELKQIPLALNYYQQAMNRIGESFEKIQIQSNIALVYAENKNYETALLQFQQALRTSPDNLKLNPPAEIINESGSKRLLLAVIQDKADTWLAYAKHTRNDKTKLQNALNTYMLADTMIDYMRWDHTGMLSKLFWRENTRAMFENAIETSYLLSNPSKALYFFEKSRAVMLNDQINELGASQLLSESSKKEEAALKQKIADLKQKLNDLSGDEIKIRDLRIQLFSALDEQKSFIKNLEKTNPQYYAYRYDNNVLSINELRSKVLINKQTFVSYFVGDSAVYGLCVSPDKMMLKKISLSDYKFYTSKFQAIIGNRDLQNRQFSEYLSVSSKLYDLLLKPFGINPASRVIISPDGSFLPFEALSSSASKPEYLVKKYAFSYTYSAGFLTKSLRSESNNFSTKAFLGLAPVQFAPKLSQAALPGSDLALKAINKYFFFSKTLTGADASRDAFVKDSPDYKIVQLLTHATADSTGTIPTLYFADSTLMLNELSTAGKSDTELLVLSACQTGVGKNQRGEGVFSLARGFAGMGIPSTLTTLWSVENEAIYGLTKLFYAELEKGIPLDLALQNAQNEWLTTASSSDRLPYAWAGMVLVGNSEPVGTGFSKITAYVLSAIAILLLVSVAIFLRRQRAKVNVS